MARERGSRKMCKERRKERRKEGEKKRMVCTRRCSSFIVDYGSLEL